MAAPRKSKKTGRRPYNKPALKSGEGRDLSFWKPEKFKNYLTLGELAYFVPCDPTWLRHLERVGRIPQAARVRRGKLNIRLWSPEQAEEIRGIIQSHKVGRPRAAAE
jgi:hypothetical protein